MGSELTMDTAVMNAAMPRSCAFNTLERVIM